MTISDNFGLVKSKVGNSDFKIFTFFKRILKSLNEHRKKNTKVIPLSMGEH